MLSLEQIIERLNEPDPKRPNHSRRFKVCAEEVGPQLGLHPETIRRVRKGINTPRYHVLKKLSDYLGGEL